MCRHLAYVGPPVRIGSLLLDGPHSLRRQTHAPRLMQTRHENPDGWGVAWYEPEVDAPRRYRTTVSLRHDVDFADADTHASSMLAAVRLASPGLALERDNTAPFLAGPLAFSLNGYAFRNGCEARLRAEVPPERATLLEGDTDSEVLFALVLERLGCGATPAEALRDVTALTDPDDDLHLNLLLTDGRTITATAWGNSLFTRDTGDAVLVASEPLDEDAGWTRVPERSLVEARPGAMTVTGLERTAR